MLRQSQAADKTKGDSVCNTAYDTTENAGRVEQRGAYRLVLKLGSNLQQAVRHIDVAVVECSQLTM
jgi:hypothetical protein